MHRVSSIRLKLQGKAKKGIETLNEQTCQLQPWQITGIKFDSRNSEKSLSLIMGIETMKFIPHS